MKQSTRHNPGGASAKQQATDAKRRAARADRGASSASAQKRAAADTGQSTAKTNRAAANTREDAFPNLDSSFFLAFELTHAALKRGLKNACDLNVTQYRALVKTLAAAPSPVSQSDLAAMLGLKPNVTTQAINALERAGLAVRARSEADNRARLVSVTEAGRQAVERVNRAVIEQLYALFPTEDAHWRKILEASVAAGARIDPPTNPAIPAQFPASRALVSLELLRQAAETALHDACGATFSECRVLQLLGEAGRPLRITGIADELDMTAANVARAVDRLAGRAWVRRLGSARDKKAVYVAMTPEGEFQCNVLNLTANELGAALLWPTLTAADRAAIMDVGRVVIAGMRRRKAESKRANESDLEPLD